MGTEELKRPKLRAILSRMPVLSWPAAIIAAMSGVTKLAAAVQADPENPFLHYRLAMRFETNKEFQDYWRLGRAVATLGHSEIAGFVVRNALDIIDGPQASPELALLLNTVVLAHKQLRFDPSNQSLMLVLGAASTQLAKKTKDRAWLARAIRAFISVLRSSDNPYLLTDACIGLAGCYTIVGDEALRRKYRDLAVKLMKNGGMLMRTKTRKRAAGVPSLWRINDVAKEEWFT
jgi:hypothetical protein